MRQWRSLVLRLAANQRVLTRLWREADGTEAIEFAMVAPLLLLFLVGVVEFSRLYWTQSELQFAAEAAARTATVYAVNGYTAAQVQTNTQTQGAANPYGLSVPAGDFVLTLYNAATNTPSCGNQVTVTYPFTFIASDLFPFHITLTATACHMG
jgi:Flp pilus assembly protein TadG